MTDETKEKMAEKETTTPAEDNKAGGDKPQEPDYLKQFREERKRMEDAAARMEKANAEAKEIEGRRILAGEADAGQSPMKKDETPSDYVNKLMGGK